MSPSGSLNILYKTHLVIALMALLCLVFPYLPITKSWLIFPQSVMARNLFADGDSPPGQSRATWVDYVNNAFECEFKRGIEYPFCGLSLKFYDTQPERTLQTFDLTEFDFLDVSIKYRGDSPTLRLYLRDTPLDNDNLDKNYSEHFSQKFMYQTFIATSEVSTVRVKLVDFHVADWWLTNYESSPKDRLVTMNRVFEFGIDIPTATYDGKHFVHLLGIKAGTYAPAPKPFQFAALCLVIVAVVGQIIFSFFSLYFTNRGMQSENANLRESVYIDGLTQVLNRKGLDTEIERRFKPTKDSALLIAIFDLDHFKSVNDTYGHAIGDEVLSQTGLHIKQRLRDIDVFGRWGGEEFVLISETDTAYIEPIIERLMEAVRKVKVVVGDNELRVTVSVGVTLAVEDESFEEAFRRADKALYAAKNGGRNTWRVRLSRPEAES